MLSDSKYLSMITFRVSFGSDAIALCTSSASSCATIASSVELSTGAISSSFEASAVLT